MTEARSEDGTPPRLRDVWLAATERREPETTTHLLRSAPTLQAGERKDRILFRGALQPLRASIDDISFCHRYQIIRNVLPAGPIDGGTFFKTSGSRGEEVIEVDLAGAQVAAHADALERVQRESPTWAGFRRWQPSRPTTSRTTSGERHGPRFRSGAPAGTFT